MREIIGYRFHPTDKELVGHYLRCKNSGLDSVVENAISDINMCKFDPWELPDQATIKTTSDWVWYFFCRPDYKYSNSQKTKRTTKNGFWKVTGVDRKIKDDNGNKIGIKKTLVFYQRDQSKPRKTDWVMHEYSHFPLNRGGYVVCKVKNKGGTNTDAGPSPNVTSENLLQFNPQIQVAAESSVHLGKIDVETVGWSELCGRNLESPCADVCGRNLMQPNSLNLTVEDQEFLNQLPSGYRQLGEQLLGEPGEFSGAKAEVFTRFSDYRPQASLSGVYDVSSSDSDSETTDQESFEEISSPTESVGSSKEWNKINEDGSCDDEDPEMDTCADGSEVIDDFTANTDTGTSPNQLKDQARALNTLAEEASEPRTALDPSRTISIKQSEISCRPKSLAFCVLKVIIFVILSIVVKLIWVP